MTDIEASTYSPALSGDWDYTGGSITVPTPSSETDCSTKAYVDSNTTLFLAGNNEGSPASGTVYVSPQGAQIDDTDVDDVMEIIPVNGTLQNVYFRVNINTATFNTGFINSYVNGNKGDIQIKIPDATTGIFSETTATESISAGDTLAWEFDFDVSEGTTQEWSWGFELAI